MRLILEAKMLGLKFRGRRPLEAFSGARRYIKEATKLSNTFNNVKKLFADKIAMITIKFFYHFHLSVPRIFCLENV